MANAFSKFYQSFSGTDTLAFIMLPGCSPVCLGALTTISYSMFRNKVPVTNIGRINVNGLTRGVRIYAGTMVFTLINQHWVREVQDQLKQTYIARFKEIKTDDLPLFDIMIISANEYGSSVIMYIWGIDVTDEAQTISVNDLFTENTFRFVARDITGFHSMKKEDYIVSSEDSFPNIENNSTYSDIRNYIFDNHKNYGESNKFRQFENNSLLVSNINTDKYNEATSPLKLPITSLSEAERYFQSELLPPAQFQIETDKLLEYTPQTFSSVYYNKYRLMSGPNIEIIQKALNEKGCPCSVTGVFDAETDMAVKQFQSKNNLNIDGVVTDKVFYLLMDNNTETSDRSFTGIIVNCNNAPVYKSANMDSTIVDFISYRECIKILDTVTGVDGVRLFYKIEQGYINIYDVYSNERAQEPFYFPTIKIDSTDYRVTYVQSLLKSLYSDLNVTSIYDQSTVDCVKDFQANHSLPVTGIIDYATWLELLSISDDTHKTVVSNEVIITFSRVHGEYIFDNLTPINEYLSSFNVDFQSSRPVIVKCSAIAYCNDLPIMYDTKIVTVNMTEIMYFDIFSDLFSLMRQSESKCTHIEIIIYPTNKSPYKWVFKM